MNQKVFLMSLMSMFLTAMTKAQVTVPTPTFQYTFDGDGSSSVIEYDGTNSIDNLNSTYPVTNPFNGYANTTSTDRHGNAQFIHDNVGLKSATPTSRFVRLDGTNQIKASGTVTFSDFTRHFLAILTEPVDAFCLAVLIR